MTNGEILSERETRATKQKEAVETLKGQATSMALQQARDYLHKACGFALAAIYKMEDSFCQSVA